ncbi:hypothetical protein HMJ29_02650 [Hymenobacter taeanensis]|uniref:Lipoprotein n=1 Tax=Hymenobacter taeanensis TaxID=2735321 RepID=A0A6M6BF79_9BACT|nr:MULTISPECIES: hypothetical protein [Hymenobacter]QJX45893.1 hypothetical protein HMJ29_02650 [Hymenobacter taeanensis]UOQ79740.1 hypothetical protein MUN83_12865 [Hymenobacter sp. 5414T-23]
MRRTLLCLLPLVAACSSPAEQAEQTAASASSVPESASGTTAEPLDTARPAVVNAQADTLKVVRKRHTFSAPATPDVFTLALRGPNLLSSEATFTITTASGQVIFREELTAPDLEAALVYEMKDATATQAEREAYVRRRMDEFFAEKNFQRPAIPAAATYQPDLADQAAWTDLRRRPDALGFHYLVGKEDHRVIAWSPLRKQVVRVQ